MRRLATLIFTIILLASCVTEGKLNQTETNTLDIAPFNEIKVGKQVLVNDPKISKFAFMYSIPKGAIEGNVVKTVLLGHGLPSPVYSDVVENVERKIQWLNPYANEHGYAILSVIIPNKAQYLERDSMIPGEIKHKWWTRPDLEYRKIIEAFMTALEKAGYTPHDQVYMTGFSNGGIQANTFSLLHPDIVEATAIGAAGVYAYPEKELEGVNLQWPLGLADNLNNITFTPELFKEVEHLVFVGSEDIHNDPLEFKYHDYKKKFGATTVDRVPIFANYLKEYGVDAQYKVYDDLGHNWTDEMLEATFDFFDSVPTD